MSKQILFLIFFIPILSTLVVEASDKITSCTNLLRTSTIYEVDGGNINVRNANLGTHMTKDDPSNLAIRERGNSTLSSGALIQVTKAIRSADRGGCLLEINLVDDPKFIDRQNPNISPEEQRSKDYNALREQCSKFRGEHSNRYLRGCFVYFDLDRPHLKPVHDPTYREIIERKLIDQVGSINDDVKNFSSCRDSDCDVSHAGVDKPIPLESDGDIEIEKKRADLLRASYEGRLKGQALSHCKEKCKESYPSDSQCEAYCEQIKNCANQCKTSDIVEQCKQNGPTHDETCVANIDLKCSPFSATQGVHFGESSRLAVVKNYLTSIMGEVFADEKFASLRSLAKGNLSGPEYLANYFICYTKVVENSPYEPVNRTNDPKGKRCAKGYTAFGIGQITRSTFFDVFGLNQKTRSCFDRPIGESQNCTGSAPHRYRSELLLNDKYRGLTPNQLYDLQAFDVNLQLRSMVGVWLNMYKYGPSSNNFLRAWDRYRGNDWGTSNRDTFAVDFLRHTKRKTEGMTRAKQIQEGIKELDECATKGYEKYKPEKLK